MGRTIIVLDDENAAAEMVRRACTTTIPACEVRTASRVSEAVTFLRDMPEPPALVIVDLYLDNESGLALVDYIRADDATATVPIVVMSARGAPADVDKALRLGANAFIHKAGSLDKLLKMTEAVGRIWLPTQRR